MRVSEGRGIRMGEEINGIGDRNSAMPAVFYSAAVSSRSDLFIPADRAVVFALIPRGHHTCSIAIREFRPSIE